MTTATVSTAARHEPSAVPSARSMAAMTAELFNRAGRDPDLSRRMSSAHTVLAVHFEDPRAHAAVTIKLNEETLSAELGLVGQAEIELHASSPVWMELIAGRAHLPIAIVCGDVTYQGPVRKFLRVVPILRAFDFEPFRRRPRVESQPAAGASPTV